MEKFIKSKYFNKWRDNIKDKNYIRVKYEKNNRDKDIIMNLIMIM